MNEIELKRRAEADQAKGPERKVYEVKADDAAMDGNLIKGNPSVMGFMDKGRDVMFPGAYKKSLPGFLANGFIAWSHDWSEIIGYPTVAREEGKNLYSEAIFHSTPKAQEIRAICMERLSAKKSVGLSVGFMPDYSEGYAFMDEAATDYKTDAQIVYFANGDALLTFAKSNGYDMSLFDTKSIKACKDYCRGIRNVAELFEWSPCGIPMNPKATATDAKTFNINFDSLKVFPATVRDFEEFLRESGASKQLAISIASVGFAKAMQRESAIAPEADATPPEPATADDGLLRKLQAAQLRFSPLLTEVNH